MVEKNTCPPGRTSFAHAATMLAGCGTCSSNSMQVTASNSPCGSRQRCASELNLASSAGSAFMQRFSQIKRPAGAGLAGAGEGLRLPRADDLDLDAAIRRQAGHQLLVAAVLGAHLLAPVAGHGLLLALALGVDAVRLDALRHQIGLDRFGAAHRQLLVVGVRADRIGMADGDD